MNVLGLKIRFHDTGAALISGSKVVAISEERLNRVKHSREMFPELSIQYCLDAMGLRPGDIDLIVMDQIYDREDVKTKDSFLTWKDAVLFKNAKIEVINHHAAHAASAFFCSPFDEAAILVYDGGGEAFKSNTGAEVIEMEAFFRGKGNTLTLLRRTTHLFNPKEKGNSRFPLTWGPGRLYSYLSTAHCNLGAYNEGKLMGLAAYGDDSLLKKFPLEMWVKENADDVVCNARVYPASQNVATKLRRNWKSIFPALLYKAMLLVRQIRLAFADLLVGRESMHSGTRIFPDIHLLGPARKDEKLPDTYYASVAYLAQQVFEHTSAIIGKKLRAMTGMENLCISGGCGLNIDANARFLSKEGGAFKRLFVQPAASDSGIPLGAALYGYHVIGGKSREWEMKSAALGRPYTGKEIDEAIEKIKDKIVVKQPNDVCKEAAQLIAGGNIIGWFHGGSEYGPRALGNRSILCDARNPKAKDVLNERVKHREIWRPFAASVLEEKMQEWFEINVPSPFMLIAANVRKEKMSLIPSLVHKDGTCRLQSVTPQSNKKYYDLIKAYDAITGVPAILNTSFNLGGDPIIETPANALDTFMRTDLDSLILENYVISKQK